MRAPRTFVGAGLLLALAAAAPAAAQFSTDRDRIRIHVDAGGQLSPSTFETRSTGLVYLENAVIDSSYTVPSGLMADAGVSVRIAGPISIGVTVSSFMPARDAAVSAALPHPFFFATPRTVNGIANSLQRDELVTHIQGIYTIRPSAKIDLAVSAGPSFFHISQALVSDVAFADTYPYDAPTFRSAPTQRITSRKTGFNVGADIGYRLSRHAGVGGTVRFAGATATLAVPNSTTTVSVSAGGAQLGGGLRLYF